MPNYNVSVTRIQSAPAVSAVSAVTGDFARNVDFKIESLPSGSTRYLKNTGTMDKSTANCEYLSELGGLIVTVDNDVDSEIIVNEALEQAQIRREAV